eukprot:scaffold43_cov65-Phaeocystis_antarctica.AAC.2
MAFCVHVIRHPHHASPRRDAMAAGGVLRKEQNLRDELLQEPHVAWHRGVGEANHNAARAAARAPAEQHGAEEEVAPREPEDVEPAPERRLTGREQQGQAKGGRREVDEPRPRSPREHGLVARQLAH